MANVDAPRGARPVRHRNGAPYTGSANRYYVGSGDSTAIFLGDFVKSSGSADSDGIPGIAQAAAGDAIRGVVVGIEPTTDESPKHRAASTEAYIYVADDPDLVFEIQEDSVGGALAAANVGQNADVIVGTGSTTTGLSAMEIDSSSATASTAQLRIMALVQMADNEIGTNAKWEVMINEHELTSTSGV